jgi:hypothetical protein
MSTVPEAYISHASSGRLRVRVPAKKNDPIYFSDLREYLAPVPGVVRVEVNPLTASVLVEHQLDLNSMDDLKPVADYSEMSGLFKLVVPTRAAPNRASIPLGQFLAATMARFNEQVRSWTSGMLDFPTVAALGLISVGVVQASRGLIAVPAISALWYASEVLKFQFANNSTPALTEDHRGRHFEEPSRLHKGR